jgi:hypothetical protein
MPRPKAIDSMSVAQLMALMNAKKQRLATLERTRKQMVSKLAKIDAEIAALSGGKGVAGMTPSGRPRNTKSLPDLMIEVLGAGKPLKVGEILDAVIKKGYRSNSRNFRSLINQTLIKDKRFTAVSRGTYTLKK